MTERRQYRDAERVRHILDAADKLAEIVAAGRESFDAGWRECLLAERLLMIIGEAGRHLSEEFVAARPALQVHRARGMRNFLVHEYDDVDPDHVWVAITVSVPEFLAALEPWPDSTPPVP